MSDCQRLRTGPTVGSFLQPTVTDGEADSGQSQKCDSGSHCSTFEEQVRDKSQR